MAGHRDAVVSATVGTQVAGLKINEALVEAIWGPNATMDQVADALRGYVRVLLILQHQARTGGTLLESEMYVDQNTGRTE